LAGSAKASKGPKYSHDKEVNGAEDGGKAKHTFVVVVVGCDFIAYQIIKSFLLSSNLIHPGGSVKD